MSLISPRLVRRGLSVVGIVLYSTLVLSTRCANREDVFVNGATYFTDADCYARMTRARMCFEHPGLVVRHHDFENFPAGTTPHTTAPLDYMIVLLAWMLKPLSAYPLDIAGAMISPLLALSGGLFLWWWARGMKFAYRSVALLLYAASPILVHATELGRPDHQSLLVVLILIAFCAEWRLRTEASWQWAAVSGIAWGLALWTSLYEPLVLLCIVLICHALTDRDQLAAPHRRVGWIILSVVVMVAAIIERRIFQFAVFPPGSIAENWARSIGELAPVRITDLIWLRWFGYFILLAPALTVMAIWKRRRIPGLPLALLFATFALTVFQARWAYSFAVLFVLTIPILLAGVKSRAVVWTIAAISFLPILREWDERCWPNELRRTQDTVRRLEAVQLREVALRLRAVDPGPFLAPWWLSPAIAYWSVQPGVAGSSHESLPGIEKSARFMIADDMSAAREVLCRQKVTSVIAYDAQRVSSNSAALLGIRAPQSALISVLDRAPTGAPPFLRLSYQSGVCKLYRFEHLGEMCD
ncbi:MAG: hypothetical protein ABI871_06085 [Chthoniobacterales bacterium]